MTSSDTHPDDRADAATAAEVRTSTDGRVAVTGPLTIEVADGTGSWERSEEMERSFADALADTLTRSYPKHPAAPDGHELIRISYDTDATHITIDGHPTSVDEAAERWWDRTLHAILVGILYDEASRRRTNDDVHLQVSQDLTVIVTGAPIIEVAEADGTWVRSPELEASFADVVALGKAPAAGGAAGPDANEPMFRIGGDLVVTIDGARVPTAVAVARWKDAVVTALTAALDDHPNELADDS